MDGTRQVTAAATDDVSSLLDTVVDGGYCVGCGACASIPGSPLRVSFDEFGKYRATRSAGEAGPDPEGIRDVCPFSDSARDEDEIGNELFSEHCARDNRIGFHLATYAGHVVEEGFRDLGSSGGMASWILVELFRKNLIDAVIHVGAASPSEDDPALFRYQVSRTEEDIRRRAKSRYYPIEMSGVIREVLEKPGRYALVGLPCFVKAVRLLQRRVPELEERIAFTVGIFCGHLKSTRFAELFSWQCGIKPGDIAEIDFRKKIPGQKASEYGIEITGHADGETKTAVKTNADFYGSNWGHGLFKYEACDYCDDVVAETADIAVGDAWLEGYVDDSKGTNVVVVREPRIEALLGKALDEGRLKLDRISPDDVAHSQISGLRHRREGLAYRLLLKDRENLWRPPKRIKASEEGISSQRKKIYRLRTQLAAESHPAFAAAIEAGSFETFTKRLRPLVKSYEALYSRPPLWRRAIPAVARRLKKGARALLGTK